MRHLLFWDGSSYCVAVWRAVLELLLPNTFSNTKFYVPTLLYIKQLLDNHHQYRYKLEFDFVVTSFFYFYIISYINN